LALFKEVFDIVHWSAYCCICALHADQFDILSELEAFHWVQERQEPYCEVVDGRVL
jgi:hypothetical protein